MVEIRVKVSKRTIDKICEVENKLDLRGGPIDDIIIGLSKGEIKWTFF